MRGLWRVFVLGAAAVAAVVAFVLLREEDEPAAVSPPPAATVPPTAEQPPSPAPPPPRVVRIDGRSGGIDRATVNRGDRVVLVVTGPPGEEIHLHGYDITRAVGPRGRGFVEFRATVPGRFEVELHGSGEQIGDITVR